MKTIDLNGKWEYKGNRTGWMTVPGVVEQIEDEREYCGVFRLKKTFVLDEKEADKRYVLNFHGVSYTCNVFCNGRMCGEHEGIWDAFKIEITDAVKVGENEIEVELRKPDFEKDSPYFFRSVLFGFIPDIMLPFGGIWKEVEIEIKEKYCFEDFSVLFNTEHKSAELEMKLSNMKDETEKLWVKAVLADPDGKVREWEIPYEDRVSLKLDEIVIWAPDSPAVYKGTVQLCSKEGIQDEAAFSGGFRKIRIENGEIYINDKPFYMRGILHWGYYPEKMCPDPSYEEVKTELLKIRDMGFNTVKHCLYFPPEYYYELCDELGIVTWQELPLWLPYCNEYLIDRIFSQYPKMINIFKQYPTVVLASLGCELDGTVGSETLNNLYYMLKKEMPEAIVCDNSGSGECFDGVKDSESDIYDYHFYAELYNLNQLMQEFTSGYRKKKPWLFGEFNDSDTFRLVKNKENKWWCSPLESKNPLRKVHKGFGSDQPVYYQDEILEKYGVREEAESLEKLSIEQMKDIRKFILETTRSFPEIKGYNITTLRDVPLTTAGMCDDEMECKVDPEWFRKVNGDVVVSFQKDLARIWKNGADRFFVRDRFNYVSEEKLHGRFSVSNRSEGSLDGEYIITLEDQGKVVCAYQKAMHIQPAETVELEQQGITMPVTGETKCLELRIRLTYGEKEYENSWFVWVYPKNVTERKIHVLDSAFHMEGIEDKFQVHRLADYDAVSGLKEGDILVTSQLGKSVKEAAKRGVKVIAFVSAGTELPIVNVPFYREAVIKIQDHPAMQNLEHRGFAGLQFLGVAGDKALEKIEFEKQYPCYKSLIRRFDARNFSTREYAVEFTEGRGRVILSTLNISGGKGEQPSGFTENKLAVKLLDEWIKYIDAE